MLHASDVALGALVSPFQVCAYRLLHVVARPVGRALALARALQTFDEARLGAFDPKPGWAWSAMLV